MDSPPLGLVSSRPRSLHVVVFLCCFALLSACADDAPLATASYRLIGPPVFADGCPAAPQPTPIALEIAPTSARFTYRRPSGELVCDAVVPAGDGGPIIAVPAAQGELIDVYVELFADVIGVPTLLGTGTAVANLAAGGTIDIFVTPRERFSCPRDRPGTARAFHTASVLPAGRVLIIGGLVADPTGMSDVVNEVDLFVTSSAELYDPATGQFSAISIADLAPRALHHAVTLDNGDIALIGGITVSGDPQTTAALGLGAGYRLEPTVDARSSAPQVVRYDPATSNVTLIPIADLAGLVPRIYAGTSTPLPAGSASRVVIAGGVTEPDVMGPRLRSYELIDPGDQVALLGGDLVVERVGATVTALDDGGALVWGGNLGSLAADASVEAGELIAGLAEAQTPVAMLMGYSAAGDAPTPRVFHAAARAGDGSVVVAGGYAIAPNLMALAIEGVFAQRITAGGTATVRSLAILGGGAPDPAVYVDVTALADGDVLITGGSPAIGVGLCPDTLGGAVCTTSAAYRYRLGNDSLSEPVGQLLIARYGHRTVVLPNGTALITGGIASDGISLRVLSDAEVFDPRDEQDDPLAVLAPEITRLPGDVARAQGEPVAPCTLIETVSPD